jgi:hypothetical protein
LLYRLGVSIGPIAVAIKLVPLVGVVQTSADTERS